MMNKDEIQLSFMASFTVFRCGLVMNKDEIQQSLFGQIVAFVVVW